MPDRYDSYGGFAFVQDGEKDWRIVGKPGISDEGEAMYRQLTPKVINMFSAKKTFENRRMFCLRQHIHSKRRRQGTVPCLLELKKRRRGTVPCLPVS